MRNNLFKRIMAFSLATVMTVGMTGVISARVADGTNVSGNGTWTSFSICTREDGGVWEDALIAIPQVKGVDYATEGWLSKSTATDFDFYVANSGWDGEYNTITNELVNDNPWGMTATMENIPVEAGRNYTISFNVKSSLKATATNKETNQTETITTKHILFKAYEPGNGDPAFDLVGSSNISSDGYMLLDSTKGTMAVKATIKIPSDYGVGKIGLKFALGAFLKTYPKEIGLKGYINVTDFKVSANKQHKVTYQSQGKTVSTKYVNAGDKAANYKAKRKGYTLAGYKLNGKNFSFSSAINSDVTLVAQWKKTAKPAKVKIASLKSNGARKAVVSLKKMKKVNGYQVQYATNSKFKKAKTKTTTKAKITLKKLASGKVVYVRAKAYVKDSAGNKVLSKKWSAKKLVVVK